LSAVIRRSRPAVSTSAPCTPSPWSWTPPIAPNRSSSTAG
jgi:hypothetical protein